MTDLTELDELESESESQQATINFLSKRLTFDQQEQHRSQVIIRTLAMRINQLELEKEQRDEALPDAEPWYTA
jgi:uncharacterized coiled-coil protein SlyX